MGILTEVIRDYDKEVRMLEIGDDLKSTQREMSTEPHQKLKLTRTRTNKQKLYTKGEPRARFSSGQEF